MWYVSDMSRTQTYRVRLGDRGRLVLPAELRRRAGLEEGQELVLSYERGVVRMMTRADLAAAGLGMFADTAPGRDLAAELIAERRAEAARE
jgi:AbrB family looped-hinge helix DNA binding protein